jgi:hypothetical protein
LIGVLVILAAMAVSVVVMQRQSADDWDDTAGALRVLVAPFHVEASVREWEHLALEDSLAARLGADSRLVARTDASAAASDYVLDGDVSPDGDRYVITLRLRPPGQRAASWTATFWRRTLVDTALARDLAAEVREAMRLKSQ